MCLDALERNESCGGLFRVEYQTAEGEAARNDAIFHVDLAHLHHGASVTPVGGLE